MKDDTQCSYCGRLNGGHSMACSSIHMDTAKPKQIPVTLSVKATNMLRSHGEIEAPWRAKELTKLSAVESEQRQDWFFTFGSGHGRRARDRKAMSECCVKVHGSFADARAKIMVVYGNKWAFQYESAGDDNGAGVDRWGYELMDGPEPVVYNADYEERVNK